MSQLHFITLFGFFFLAQVGAQLICERAIFGNGIFVATTQNVSCNSGEICGRIEGTTNTGSTFYGTNCYSEQTCLLSAQTEVCIAVAQDQLSGAITEGETISFCLAGCCSTNRCNSQLLPYTINSSSTAKPCFLLMLSSILILTSSLFLS